MSDNENTAAGWYEATRVASPQRPRLNFDLDVDVCVVGAGLAGLTVAREVAKRGWSVAVLEANRVAWAASGRNTGFVLPGFGESADNIVERIGLDHAKELWALSEQGVDYVRRAVEETGMPGVEMGAGWLHISKTDNDREIRNEVERLRWIGANVEFWDAARVREVLPNPRYFNALHFPGALHIHPLNYALGLAADAEAHGARIFEESPVVAIDPAGVRKRIETQSGRVRAGHVVLACNVQIGELMPRLAATLLPITTYVLVTEPIGPRLSSVVGWRGAVSDTNRADNQYRIVGGANPSEQRLQWSGRMRAWDADPRWMRRGLAADIRRNFPDLGIVEIGEIAPDVGGKPAPHPARIGVPGAHAAGPLQSLFGRVCPANDPIVIIGAVGIADCTTPADDRRKPWTDRIGHKHVCRDRQKCCGKPRHQFADLHITGQHHVAGAHAPALCLNALAHAGRINRHHRRFLEDARAVRLRIGCKAERVVEWMDMQRAGKMQRVEIARIRQHLAHARGVPKFDIGADPAQPFNLVADLAVVVGL